MPGHYSGSIELGVLKISCPFSQMYRYLMADAFKSIILYSRFPKDPELRETWVEATGRVNWKPAKTSTICSAHFDDKHFMIKNKHRRSLCIDAVPTLNVLSFHTEVSIVCLYSLHIIIIIMYLFIIIMIHQDHNHFSLSSSFIFIIRLLIINILQHHYLIVTITIITPKIDDPSGGAVAIPV